MMECIYGKHTREHTHGWNIHMEEHTQRYTHGGTYTVVHSHDGTYIRRGHIHGGTHTLRRSIHEGPNITEGAVYCGGVTVR